MIELPEPIRDLKYRKVNVKIIVSNISRFWYISAIWFQVLRYLIRYF